MAAGLEGKDRVYSELKALLTNCQPIWKEMHTGIPLPLENPDLLKLDNMAFQIYLKGFTPY